MRMSKSLQLNPLVLLARTTGLWMQGRIHFPKDRIGQVVEEQEDFVIFRHMIVDPTENQPEKPGAIFKVQFRFASMSPKINKKTSLIPIPFIVAQPGFRSKIWMLGQETGDFRGVYEWDTVASAENYWTSLPMRLMKRRSVPKSLSYEITATQDGPHPQ